MGANPGLLTLDCHKNHGGHHDLGEEEEWKKNTSMEATDGRLVRGTFPRRDIEYNSINKDQRATPNKIQPHVSPYDSTFMTKMIQF